MVGQSKVDQLLTNVVVRVHPREPIFKGNVIRR